MMHKYIIGDIYMTRGVKRGYKQTTDHIEKRNKSRTIWNGGHNVLTTETFIKKVILKWPDCPYDLSSIVYQQNNVKVTIGCPTHGNFEKWPSDLLNKSGCPKCSGNGFTKEEYLSQLKDKFPEYDFSSAVYLNATTNMDVICKDHGIFVTTRNKLLNGVRCPICSANKVLAERISSGRAKDPASLTEYEQYRRAVWKETNATYKQYSEVLGERSRTRHLDHIYSIVHGFRDGISPAILGNIVNLRIIDSKENQSKNTNSHYTKEELMLLYEGQQK